MKRNISFFVVVGAFFYFFVSCSSWGAETTTILRTVDDNNLLIWQLKESIPGLFQGGNVSPNEIPLDIAQDLYYGQRNSWISPNSVEHLSRIEIFKFPIQIISKYYQLEYFLHNNVIVSQKKTIVEAPKSSWSLEIIWRILPFGLILLLGTVQRSIFFVISAGSGFLLSQITSVVFLLVVIYLRSLGVESFLSYIVIWSLGLCLGMAWLTIFLFIIQKQTIIAEEPISFLLRIVLLVTVLFGNILFPLGYLGFGNDLAKAGTYQVLINNAILTVVIVALFYLINRIFSLKKKL